MSRLIACQKSWLAAALAMCATGVPLAIPELRTPAASWSPTLGSASVVARQISAIDNTTVSTGIIQFVPLVKGADTGLMAIALVLMAGTYYILIKYATDGVSAGKVPSAPLRENMQRLLEVTWPVDTDRPVREWEPTKPPKPQDRQRHLLYLGFMTGDHLDSRAIKGIKQCQAKAQDPEKQESLAKERLLLLQTESSAVRSCVQLALWEWVSMWLMAIAVLNTAIYNGFITGDSNPDAVLRLVVVLIYAAAFLLHSIYVWVSFCRIYTCFVLNGCWTMLGNAHFAAAERLGPSTKMNVFETSILGPTRLLAAYEREEREGQPKFSAKKIAKEDQTKNGICSMQQNEIKTFESMSEAAQDRILFNALGSLGIAVVTSFSTWTQSQLRDATSAQLGSLALLVTTVSGAGAMLSSTMHLSKMKSSAWRFLKMAEQIVSGWGGPSEVQPHIGFTMENFKCRSVTLRDFWGAMSLYQIPWGIVFGPAYVLLSSGRDQSYMLRVKLGDIPVSFTPEKTYNFHPSKLYVYVDDAATHNHLETGSSTEGSEHKDLSI
jgi:hypothetical protein